MPIAGGHRGKLRPSRHDTAPIKASRFDDESAATSSSSESSESYLDSEDGVAVAGLRPSFPPPSPKGSERSISTSLIAQNGEASQVRNNNVQSRPVADCHRHKPFGKASLFSMELSLLDPESYLKCTHFRDDVKDYPCSRPRGFPHVLDLERYWYLNSRDEFYQIPLIVDVITTLVHGCDPSSVDRLNNPKREYDPAFKYTLTTKTDVLNVVRKGDKITICFGERILDNFETTLVYRIVPNGEWLAFSAESKLHGRYSEHPQRPQMETIGTALGRTLMNIIMREDTSEALHEVTVGGTAATAP